MNQKEDADELRRSQRSLPAVRFQPFRKIPDFKGKLSGSVIGYLQENFVILLIAKIVHRDTLMRPVDPDRRLILIGPRDAEDRILRRLQLHRHRVMPSEVIPLGEADVVRLLHAGPLAAQKLRPLPGQLPVLLKAGPYLSGPEVGCGTPLSRIAVVFSFAQVQADQIAERPGGPPDHAVISRERAFFLSAFLQKFPENFLIFLLQRPGERQHAVTLQLMACVINSGMKRLRPPKLRKVQIPRQDLFHFLLKLPAHLRQLFREIPADQVTRISAVPFGRLPAPPVKIIGEVHEILKRHLMKLHVAHIDDPEPSDAVVPRLAHLLPDLGKRRGINPLIGNRAPVVIQMIVHAVAALMLPHFLRGKRPKVSEIVIAEHADDAVQAVPPVQALNLFVSVVVLLNFLVDREHLRRMLPDFPLFFQVPDEAALCGNDLLQEGNVVPDRAPLSQKRRVALAAHADGDHVLIMAAASQRIAPVAKKSFPVDAKIPRVPVNRVLSPHLVPLFARAKAGLMMGEAPDHTVFVGELHVGLSRPVQREGARPHGRPDIVALHPQEELEHAVIERSVEAAEMLHAPAAEGRPFVIDEKAAVLDRGLLRHEIQPFVQNKLPAVHRRSISPEGKRRHADVFREGKQAVNRPPLVAAENENHILSVQSVSFPRKENAQIRLAFSADPLRQLSGKTPCPDQLLCQRTAPQRRRKNPDGFSGDPGPGIFLFLSVSVKDLRPGAGDLFKIIRHLLRNPPDARIGGFLCQ